MLFTEQCSSSKVFAEAEEWKSGLKSYSLLFLNPLCKPGPLCRLIWSNPMLESINSKQILPNIFQSWFVAVFNFGKVKWQIGKPSTKYERETRGLQIIHNMQSILKSKITKYPNDQDVQISRICKIFNY